MIIHICNVFSQVMIIIAFFELLKDNTYKKWTVVTSIFLFAAVCAVNLALALKSFL